MLRLILYRKAEGFRPYSVRMFSPQGATDPRKSFVNEFDHVDDPRKFGDAKPPVPVHGDHDLVKSKSKKLGWGMYTYTPYASVMEPTFPERPDLSQGHLAVGAKVTRTDVWNNPGEPAMVSISRFSPDNFRPVGYAENANVPDSSNVTGYMDFRHNRLPVGHADRRPFYYFCTAMFGVVGAVLVRGTVTKIVHLLWPNRGVTAAGVVDVDLSPIQPGDNVIIKFRGKPVFVRRRTTDMINAAETDDAVVSTMRDPQKDIERVKRKEWLVTLGVCTHLGCIPYANEGMYGGYFCPCHGSHYDHSGRIRFGPAPYNMEVPDYLFVDDNTIRLGVK